MPLRGRRQTGALPVLGDGGGDVVEEGGDGADVLEHFCRQDPPQLDNSHRECFCRAVVRNHSVRKHFFSLTGAKVSPAESLRDLSLPERPSAQSGDHTLPPAPQPLALPPFPACMLSTAAPPTSPLPSVTFGSGCFWKGSAFLYSILFSSEF